MSITFAGTSYDVPETMLAAARAFVLSVMPNASADSQNSEIGKMLGKGTKLVKQDAKGQHEKALTERAAAIAKDADFLRYSQEMAGAYKAGMELARGYGAKIGFIPVPMRSGDGYKGSVALGSLNIANLVKVFGPVSIKIDKNVDAPADSLDPAHYRANVANLTSLELDKTFGKYRELRQKAYDVVIAATKDLGDVKRTIAEDGTLTLSDPTVARVGTPREGGTRTATGAVKTVVCSKNGKEYTGTAHQIVDALKKDGFSSTTTDANPSHLFTDKCPKSLGISVKA